MQKAPGGCRSGIMDLAMWLCTGGPSALVKGTLGNNEAAPVMRGKGPTTAIEDADSLPFTSTSTCDGLAHAEPKAGARGCGASPRSEKGEEPSFCRYVVSSSI